MGFRDTHSLLGLPPTRVVNSGDKVLGDRPVKLLSPKQLFIHCPQINKEGNLHNGKPSDILEVLPMTTDKFGDMVNRRFLDPSFKPLAGRVLHKLSLSIKDEEGGVVDFHGSYIRYTLVIRHEHLRTE